MAYDVELAKRIRDLLADQPEVTEKRMFGGLAFLLGGRLAVSASSRGGLLVRVDPDRTEELAAEPGASRFVMRGREMTGWLHIDVNGLADDTELDHWIQRGVRYASSLPPR